MRRVARTLLAIVLVLSSIPLVPRRAAADDVSLGARIQGMLDGGEYIDGEAIVIVRSHAPHSTAKPNIVDGCAFFALRLRGA
jgi:hypothetical protein